MKTGRKRTKVIPENYAGKQFGRLTILDVVRRNSRWMVVAKCACGSDYMTQLAAIQSGRVKSCSCLKNELLTKRATKHGLAGSRIYNTWSNMIQRCENPRHALWRNYGGRGIAVCLRWHKLENFFADMGHHPAGLQLDRIDNDGDYNPGNCRWATRLQQNNNQRTSRFLKVGTMRKTVAEWSRETGINRHTIAHRLVLGWSDEKAVLTPVKYEPHS
jgi:hypothetical protein